MKQALIALLATVGLAGSASAATVTLRAGAGSFQKNDGRVLHSLLDYDTAAAHKDNGLCYVGDRNQVCALLSQLSKASAAEYQDGNHEYAKLATCFLQGAGTKPVIARTEHVHDYEAATIKAEWKIEACADATLTPTEALGAAAAGFKSLIKDEVYISEGDFPWAPAYFTAPVATPSVEAVRAALHVDAATPVSIADDESMTDFWSYYTDAQEQGAKTAKAYQALKAAMSSQLQDVRLIKVGKEDSGELELYLLGRTASGQLVGLKTFTVET